MPRPALRRLFAMLLLCSSAALIAAAPPARPTPAPTPAATPVAALPSVIVYPFAQSSDMKAGAGNAIAQIFDQTMSAAGGIAVLPTPQNVPRTDYQKNALQSRADYYITGYITPLGDGASMVMQLVGAQTGVMIYSKTAQITSADDASSQALAARQLIINLTDRETADYNAQSNATPQPSATNGASVSLGGLGSLLSIFKRGDKNAAQSLPQVAEADKPSRVAIVERVDGKNIAGGVLTSSTQLLRSALNHFYKTEITTVDTDNVAKAANAICGSKRDSTIATGMMTQHSTGGFRGRTETTFTLKVFTCFGAVLYSGSATADSVTGAIDKAVATYAESHPGNS